MKNYKRIRNSIFRWKMKKLLGALGILLVFIGVALLTTNVGIGPPKMVKGKVVSVGIDSSTIYQLPKPLITVELDNGNLFTIDGIRELNLKVGDNVELIKSKRFYTSSNEYKLHRAVK